MKRSALKRGKALERKTPLRSASQRLPASEQPTRALVPLERQTGLGRAAVKRRPTAPKRWKDAKRSRPEWGTLELGDRLEQHHVVYAQHVEDAGGDVWDPRNSLTLTARIHGHHHDGSPWKLPLEALQARHFDFAREIFGAYAYDYLRRRYAGDDPRLDALLDEV